MTCWWFFQETRFVSQEGSLVRNKAFFLTELYDRVSQFVFSLKSHLKPGHTLAISSFILGHTSLMIFCYRFEEVWFGWKNSNPLLARNQTKKNEALTFQLQKISIASSWCTVIAHSWLMARVFIYFTILTRYFAGMMAKSAAYTNNKNCLLQYFVTTL